MNVTFRAMPHMRTAVRSFQSLFMAHRSHLSVRDARTSDGRCLPSRFYCDVQTRILPQSNYQFCWYAPPWENRPIKEPSLGG